jgi:HSP20 family protein
MGTHCRFAANGSISKIVEDVTGSEGKTTMIKWGIRSDSTHQGPLCFQRTKADLLEELTCARNPSTNKLWSGARLMPLLNVRDLGHSFVIRAELPGMETDDLEIQTESDILTLRGIRKSQKVGEVLRYYHRERTVGTFHRSLALQEKVNVGTVGMAYKDGVLTIILPKAEAGLPRIITGEVEAKLVTDSEEHKTSMADLDLQAMPKQQITFARCESDLEEVYFIPAVDVCETFDALVILVDMPGVKTEDVDIEIRDDTLTFTGRVYGETDQGKLILDEYQVGNYFRAFHLVELIDRKRITATMSEGVLKLTMPKADQAVERRIPITNTF